MEGEWLPICPKCCFEKTVLNRDGTREKCDYCNGRGYMEAAIQDIKDFKLARWHGEAMNVYHHYKGGFLSTGESIADLPCVSVRAIEHFDMLSGVNQMLEQKKQKAEIDKIKQKGTRR